MKPITIIFATIAVLVFGLVLSWTPRIIVVKNDDKAREIVSRSEAVMMAIVTAYSSQESCFYPANHGCLTASGTIASVGRTLACPVTLKFGSSVEIEGRGYICEDRMAKRFSTTRFDVFMERDDAVRWGVREMEIKIIK